MTTVNKLQKSQLALSRNNKSTQLIVSENKQSGRSTNYVLIENGKPRFLTTAEVKRNSLWQA